ncbi:MAG: ketol-acid reductoisomerase [Candidatus Zixiibacteriota bacterium]|nr:MAG: ketol-acid reductoisomerase [candidate division Zixibacteria bacterium]
MENKIGIIGYGSQGRAIALNLKDSGLDIAIGLKSGSKSRKVANKDGFAPILTVSNLVKKVDTICFAFPDHLHGRIYEKEIKPFLKSGVTLWFLHGTSVHFGFVKPPEDCDVIMIAPHAPGITVREKYQKEKDLSAFISIYQNFSGQAEKKATKLANLIGFKKKNLVNTNFELEAVGDLFGEQAVLCGGMAGLIKAGYDTLRKNGFPPENAYLEVSYQLDLIIYLIKNYGIEGMYNRISVAAQFGSVMSSKKLIDKHVRKQMEIIFNNIKSGKFPKELNNLTDSDIKKMSKSLKALSSEEFEEVAKKFSPKNK